MNDYERCPSCAGSGLASSPYTGEPDWCRDCFGNGVIRAWRRDERGRFAKPGETPLEHIQEPH